MWRKDCLIWMSVLYTFGLLILDEIGRGFSDSYFTLFYKIDFHYYPKLSRVAQRVSSRTETTSVGNMRRKICFSDICGERWTVKITITFRISVHTPVSSINLPPRPSSSSGITSFDQSAAEISRIIERMDRDSRLLTGRDHHKQRISLPHHHTAAAMGKFKCIYF